MANGFPTLLLSVAPTSQIARIGTTRRGLAPHAVRGGRASTLGAVAGESQAKVSRVLVVDDEQAIRDFLARGLREEGFSVDAVADVATARGKLTSAPPELVLLDVNLAGDDGLGLLSDIRRSSDIPVILLTGKGSETDRILGLKMGADDYVVKPFSLGELSARIESVLRRSKPRAAVSHVMDFGRLHIDTVSREISVDGAVLETTAKEFDLLAYLASSPRQVFTRDQLLEHVWSSSSAWQDAATVTEHVRRVRKKIEDDPDHPRWIMTVRGVGYRFEP
jgi:two-component system, OmpR family, phosphate regulon response regulator PhoB